MVRMFYRDLQEYLQDSKASTGAKITWPKFRASDRGWQYLSGLEL